MKYFYIKHCKIKYITDAAGIGFLGPPGLGGDNLGLPSVPSQSFLIGGGTGVVNVAIETSPIINT